MNFDARHEGLTAKLKSPPPLYSRLVDEERLGKTLKPAGKEVTVGFDYARFEGKVVSRKEGVDYVRTEIPEVETVFPEGEHYEAVVPDTFDIEERSRLAVHGLTCVTDPNADFEIHWWGDFTRRPPVLHHDWNDTVQPKFMEALPLLRVVSGSKENWHVEQRWSEIALHMQGPDGLLYYPVIGRPWNFDTEWEGVANRQEHVAPHGMEGRMLGAMTVFYYRDRSPVWREASERLLQGIKRMTIDKGSYAYIPYRSFGVGESASNEPEPPVGSQYAFISAWFTMGLMQHYRATGSKEALEFENGGAKLDHRAANRSCFWAE